MPLAHEAILAFLNVKLVIVFSESYSCVVKQSAAGLATPEVVALCGVPSSTLSNWVEKGLCKPSLAESGGRQRATQYWSVRDVVTIRTVRTLRQAGCPLAVLRQAAEILATRWKRGLSDAVLWWDGEDILTLSPAGDVVSLVTRKGQGIFSVAAVVNVSCPVGEWERQLHASLEGRDPLPLAQIRARREDADRRRRPSWPTPKAATGS